MTDTAIAVDPVHGEAYATPHPDHRLWKLRLRQLLDDERHAAGMSYTDLGDAVGIHPDTLADMITGDHPITLDQVHFICFALGIRLEPPAVDRSGL